MKQKVFLLKFPILIFSWCSRHCWQKPVRGGPQEAETVQLQEVGLQPTLANL